MHKYRVEVRVFGLLLFALVSTAILGVGIRASGVEGKLFGIDFFVAGPSAAFFIMLLLFYFMGLFTLGISTDESIALNHPIEKMTADEIDTMLDELEIRGRRLSRRTKQLQAAKAALASDASAEAVNAAMGLRAVRRPQST